MNFAYLRSRWMLLIVALLPLVSLLAGCSQAASSDSHLAMAKLADMPADVRQAAVTVSDAYRFAVANPASLKNVPCYCGCGAVGHTSNYSCFVKEEKAAGEIVFESHALGCSLCIDIAQDVMRLTQEKTSPTDIRIYIDQTYSQYGPSNMEAEQ